MERLRTEHENIRIIVSRELRSFGIRLRLKKLPSKEPSCIDKIFYFIIPERPKHSLGVPLDQLETIEVYIRNDLVKVPKVFHQLINFIKEDLDLEGLFRVEGTKAKQRVLLRILNSGYAIPEETNIVDACSVAKVFLRNIPGKLVPSDLVPWFLEAVALPESSAREALRLCVLLLPLENIYLMMYLMEFFLEVSMLSHHNRMTSHNLAVVIAPNIFDVVASKEGRRNSLRQIITLEVTITKILIEEAKKLGILSKEIITKLNNFRMDEDRFSISTIMLQRSGFSKWCPCLRGCFKPE